MLGEWGQNAKSKAGVGDPGHSPPAGTGPKADADLHMAPYSLPGHGDAKDICDLIKAPMHKGPFDNDLANKYI